MPKNTFNELDFFQMWCYTTLKCLLRNMSLFEQLCLYFSMHLNMTVAFLWSRCSLTLASKCRSYCIFKCYIRTTLVLLYSTNFGVKWLNACLKFFFKKMSQTTWIIHTDTADYNITFLNLDFARSSKTNQICCTEQIVLWKTHPSVSNFKIG